MGNRTITFNSNFEWYIVYLHAAHIFEDQKQDPAAPLIALCPSCHCKFYHPKTESDFFFIGRVMQQFIEEGARSGLAGLEPQVRSAEHQSAHASG